MAAKSIRVTIVVETKRKVVELSVVGAFVFLNACYGRRADPIRRNEETLSTDMRKTLSNYTRRL